MSVAARRLDPWVDRIAGSLSRVTATFDEPYASVRESSRVIPHLDGCLVAFVYSDNQGTPKRHIKHIAGYRCPKCRFDAIAGIEEHLTELGRGTVKVGWLAAFTPNERRNVVQWRRRNRVPVEYLAVTRPDRPVLWLSSRRVPGEVRPRSFRSAVEMLCEDLWTGPRVKHTAWSERWRPVADLTARPGSGGGVAAGFTRPERADDAIRQAGYHPDVPSGCDAPVVAANIQQAIESINDGHDHGADPWGRPRKPEDTR